ncbi:hypothetical protein F1B92_08135 [Campylobacter sp. FMV-PI01]|uniref:Uncharacterized protein n=1 Tax=Campylobacter portucalensis TaxID=2608384 RepID=A0A6L5WLG5_9BACT|nr:hypothetical protein [Campylobacter portucalensis]MSN97127.1 hypothetical protein [Campylobacter portucalensis]
MGFFYKKCEVCGNNISKLQCLILGGFNPTLKCQHCETEYQITKTRLYSFIDSIALEIFTLFSLFCAFIMISYVDKNFLELSGVYFFILIAVFTLLFGFLIDSFLYAMFIVLFVAKFEVKKNDIENKKSKNIFSKFFNKK